MSTGLQALLFLLMSPWYLKFWICLILWLISQIGMQAELFIAPQSEALPFRRELLPIEADDMKRFSKSLTVLTSEAELSTPKDARTIAQALGLALVLDPQNKSAKDRITSYLEKSEAEALPEQEIIEAKEFLRKYYDWLSSPQAGVEGNHLAALTGEVLIRLDPENPLLGKAKLKVGKGGWNNWIAPIKKFQKRALLPKAPGKDAKPENENLSARPASISPEIIEDRKNEVEAKVVVPMLDGSLHTVLMGGKDPTNEAIEGLTKLKIEAAQTTSPGNAFKLQIATEMGQERLVQERVIKPIITGLKLLRDKLPGTVDLQISCADGGLYSYQKNRTNISGPAFLLANSALSRKPLNGTALGKLSATGELLVPDFFWRSLLSLRGSPDGRIIVPKGAEPYLVSLLTFEDPGFFLNHEVLIADSLEDYVALSSADPDESFTEIQIRFAEIRAKAQNEALGVYLANRFVRQRLLDIAVDAPYHASARLLAMQGAGERPRSLEQKVLAAEIWRIIEPMRSLLRSDNFVWNNDISRQLHEMSLAIREALDRVEAYADLGDRVLVEQARDLQEELHSLARSHKLGSVSFYETISSSRDALLETDQELRRKLSAITGDPLIPYVFKAKVPK